ncbi:acyloxyacyl hydrolase [Luteitalea sp. TBR-22]|uniref:acyloxyacyl hydrolase n=1 Tax=Luteitalea sp. TBR-22 TaxID=2802971 RepID=UPI001EF6E2D7|nr:acyloxyacyl hydrolase [Luteitalea sp. TBR-22]
MSIAVIVTAMTMGGLVPSAAGEESDRPTGDAFRKGNSEFGLLLGAGAAMDVWGGLPDSEFIAFGVRLSHVLTDPVAPGILRGNFVISAELSPLYLFHDAASTRYAGSAALVFRHYFSPGSTVRPFLSAGAGVVYSSGRIPRDISNINFTPQGGGGIAVSIHSRGVFSVEYRIHHMSDGVLTEYNPGANSNALVAALTWIH